jgi:hypothetical protein
MVGFELMSSGSFGSMRKGQDIKYPHSARLFSFCKRVLDAKSTHARVIDQDVGEILGFDPADCSHWKKGRKHVRSVDAMKSIARHLGVDERLVMDVASGAVTDVEAFIEYQGLGPMGVVASVPEAVRRDWQRRYGKVWTPDMEAQLAAFFAVNEAGLDEIIAVIHERIHFREAPLFLPEIAKAYPKLNFVSSSVDSQKTAPVTDLIPKSQRRSDGTFEVMMSEQMALRPVGRFHLARAMAPYFVSQLVETSHLAFLEHEPLMHEVYGNVFAARLLVPARMLRDEMSKVDLSRDIVGQLAQVFWVSRGLMNWRLRDVLTGAV